MAKDELRADIEAAKNRMSQTLGAGLELRKLPEHLWPGEVVELIAKGIYGKGNGVLVLTDRRLPFSFEGVMSSTTEDFPLDKVTSISWSSGLGLGAVTIFAAGAKAEIKGVPKADGKAIVDTARARLSAGSASAVSTPAAAPDAMAQLRQLGELREAGVLTDAEFEAKKAQLLTRL